MVIGLDYLRWLIIIIAIVLSTNACRVVSVSTVCELGVIDNNKLYNYSLATPTPEFPHGVLSEDGYSLFLSGLFFFFLDLGIARFSFSFLCEYVVSTNRLAYLITFLE